MDWGMAGLVGLGGASDIFSAISAMQQQQQQREVYKKALEYNDPANVLNRQQRYYDAYVDNLNKQIPNIMRTEINPMIGGRGIDPGSGAGQQIYAQALAPYYAQGWQQAGNQAQGGLNALQLAGGNVGNVYGSGGQTANALQMMALMNMLRGGGGVGGAAGGGTPYGGGSQLAAMWGQDNPAMMNFDPSYNYGVSSPGTVGALPSILTPTGAPGMI